MSYELRWGPPKPQAELGPHEGLADCLLVISINGTPGGPGALSLQAMVLGPDGTEPARPSVLHAAATYLLSAIEEQMGDLPPDATRDARIMHQSIERGLKELRRPFMERTL